MALLAFACKEESKPSGDNPPPPAASTSKPGACAAGGGEVGDPISASFFPRVASGYCLDPQNDTKTYGDKGKLSMDDVCTTALDGECEVYKAFGLVRLVALRYVDGGAGGGSVDVYLSRFKDVGGGYAMFTKRVVADGDPADPTAPRPLAAGAGGAIGTGRAYVWRGQHLAELQYNNEQETPEQLARSSDAILTALGKEIGAKLPGALDKPELAGRLPSAGLVPNGISYVQKEALGITGLGAGAVGFYRDGGKRWRLVSIAAADADVAKDEMKLLRSHAGSLPVAGVGDEAVHVVLAAAGEGPKTELLVARKGALVVGAGDEPLALDPASPPDKQAAARLGKDDAIAKVKAWLAAPPPAADAGK